MNVRRTATILGAWLALGVILWVSLNAYGDYRSALRNQDSGERSVEQTTSTDATGTVEGGEGATSTTQVAAVVIVLSDGLNMREAPGTTSNIIKKLKRGEELELVEKGTSWYKVRDAAGDEGWIAAGGQYSKLSE